MIPSPGLPLAEDRRPTENELVYAGCLQDGTDIDLLARDAAPRPTHSRRDRRPDREVATPDAMLLDGT